MNKPRPSIPAIDIGVNVWEEEDFARYPDHLKDFWQRIRLEGAARTGVPISEVVERMDEANVQVAFLIAATGGEWEVSYSRVIDLIDRYPDRFVGLAGINPFGGYKEVRKLEVAVRDYGFIGSHCYPHWFNLPPNDKLWYPFYYKCAELDVPFQLQIGHSAQRKMHTVARPILLDEVAIHFPETRIVAIHIGYPWVEEMISVSWKHANVYIGCDAHAPRYWEENFVKFVNTRGRHKVLFGTDWPIIDFNRARQEIAELALRPESEVLLMRENTRRVYRLHNLPEYRLDENSKAPAARG